MKKAFFFAVAFMVTISTLFAAPFQPTLLRLSAPGKIRYSFDGKSLSIPITVSGVPAAMYFLVYTKDKAKSINKVQNGFLGWHYMNKIDTCMYVSPLTSLAVGKNEFIWNGKGKGGAVVPADTYTYYIWAYDNIHTGDRISSNPFVDFRYSGNMGMIQEMGQNGKPLTNPVFYSGFIARSGGGENVYKWVIGSDTSDDSLIESTYFIPQGTWNFAGGVMALQPDNHSNFFWEYGNQSSRTQFVEKRSWVPNGQSQIITTWGENGQFSFGAYEESEPGVLSDGGDYLFTGDGNRKLIQTPDADFYVLDVSDGSMVRHVDLTRWWSSPDDFQKGGQMNGGPDCGFTFRNGYVFMGGGDSCIKQMVNPYAEKDDDFYLWTNGNGDGTFDLNANTNATRPWVCRDLNVGPYVFNWTTDANLFSMGSAYDMGAVTWGLLAPDGTGLGYIAVAGESAGWKWGALYVDSGSAFDGIYKDISNNIRTAGVHYLVFLGHDSIKGEIGLDVSVSEAAPEPFSVEQNTPNPFNPSTTINFTLNKPSQTVIDIFNVAGQKVDTIMNAYLSQGAHSVTWNASLFSAGVYFYSVKAGDNIKTMKMIIAK
ncbi:MAG: T9SS type A sorting domain-containing protein [Candidatus Latescibacter sp.]|nr:T9SS type A sorting domain-containing protein [Candidatus Latescibacter sp.]